MSSARAVAELLHGVLSAEPFSLERDLATLEEALEVPRDAAHGDLAFPCFTLARDLRRPPPAIAQQLLEALEEPIASSSDVGSAIAAGPYLNFTLDKAALARRLVPAALDGRFTARRPATGRRVMIEYSQPNTHKAFHVGHMRNVALGDAYVRICEWTGDDVVAANYLGDEGTHIAKCLWYFREHFQGEVPERNRGEFLGELYTRATELLDLETYTRVPLPGVVAARVEGASPHPERADWRVLEVDDSERVHRVVCGGKGCAPGDRVAYARVGSEVAGRKVERAVRGGVESVGMVLSEAELGLSEERDTISILPAETPLGSEVAELFRRPASLPAGESVLGHVRAQEAQVAEILRALEEGEPEITALWRETRAWSLQEFHEIYRWLGARFDVEFFESVVGAAGRELVVDAHRRGILVESEGAIGADLSRWNLPFFLLLKSNGSGLYSTKDLALARRKFDEYRIDRSIYVVDAGQSLHFQQVFRTLELLGYSQAAHCHHLAYGQVVLPEGKMSSRRGNVILFSQLVERLVGRIRAEFLDKYVGEWPAEEIDEAARRIAVATIRYGMLNQDSRKNIVFDLDEWTSKTGNTGPYLLYAYTRTRSILRELADLGVAREPGEELPLELLEHEQEQALLRRIEGFPGAVERAAREYEPKLVCIALYDLSRQLSRMYQSCHVKRAESDELRRARGALVEAAGLVIRDGLALLGIETLERM